VASKPRACKEKEWKMADVYRLHQS
jgi:hypothetical protein